jgi:hypothetical protein
VLGIVYTPRPQAPKVILGFVSVIVFDLRCLPATRQPISRHCVAEGMWASGEWEKGL